nr:rhodanese-like domain-containing protein [Geomonas oryzisoli]
MSVRRISCSLSALSVVALLTVQGALAGDTVPAKAKAKAKDVKSCSVCHKPAEGQLRAFFDSVAMKSQTIQLRFDDGAEVLVFDKDTLNIVNAAVPGNLEKSLRAIKKGHEVRVAYQEASNGIKKISEISIKPAMKVPAEKQLKVEQLERLISGKKKYTLVDARPAPKYQEGSIPTAINIPFPAFQKNLDKLPKDKGELLVYFCAGVT